MEGTGLLGTLLPKKPVPCHALNKCTKTYTQVAIHLKVQTANPMHCSGVFKFFF